MLNRLLLPALALGVLCFSACAPSGSDQQAKGTAAGSSPPAPTPIVQSKKNSAPQTKNSVPQGSGFDFYVLSLSWSPSYCEAEGDNANRQQCDSGRPYAFVVHGLWPQFERGYPEKCGTNEPKVSGQTLRELYDLMPSAGLIRHEWQTHGSCTGLSQSDYFDVLRAARKKVAIPSGFGGLKDYRSLSPEDVEAEFLQSNPDMAPDGISVTCDRRYLRDVRICMTKDLDFRACDEIDRRSCRKGKVVMPPVRGG